MMTFLMIYLFNMNIFRKIQYFFADLVIDAIQLRNKYRQWICGKTCGHEWGKPQRISYDSSTGRKETITTCQICGKTIYKNKRVSINYGRGNTKRPKWHRYITNYGK